MPRISHTLIAISSWDDGKFMSFTGLGASSSAHSYARYDFVPPCVIGLSYREFAFSLRTRLLFYEAKESG